MNRPISLMILLCLAASAVSISAQSNPPTTPAPTPVEVASAVDTPDYTLAVPYPVAPNANRLYDRVYRRVPDGVSLTFHDAPNGNIVGGWKAGDNFVTVYESIGDWSRIFGDYWVPNSQLTTAGVVVSSFSGVTLDPEAPLEYPLAWSLIHQYAASAPGGDPVESNSYFWRYNMMYIYDTVVDAEGYKWYNVGEDEWVHQFRVAVHHPVARPEGITTERWVGIDLYEQVLTVYEGETPVYTTLVSTGLPQWATNEGIFNVTAMFPREAMSQDLPNDFYYIQEVPWTAYFDEGIALHGTFWHDGFGYRQSHGCVNMSITDAAWVYEFLRPEFTWENGGASVYVYNTDPAATVSAG